DDGCPDPPTELYDPGLGSWSLGSSMKIGRGGHTATMLQGGKILVIGGMGMSVCTTATPVVPLTNAQIYDSTANRWSDLIPMDVGRLQHTATLLSNGRVLVVGTATSNIARAELFDATRRTWMQAGGPVNLHAQTATSLNDGRVLIAGGRSGSVFTGSQIFDPRLAASRPTSDWWVIPILGLAAGLFFLWLTIRRTLGQAWRSRKSDT